ncbi:hypothetical protein [Streptomyces bauhiniae]
MAHTTQENPVDLPMRLDRDPEPVPGCPLCDNIAHDRDRAHANGNASQVSDCNVRMRRHVTAQHTDA